MPEPFNEMQEFFRPRQDRRDRVMVWGLCGIAAAMLVCFALITWAFPFR